MIWCYIEHWIVFFLIRKMSPSQSWKEICNSCICVFHHTVWYYASEPDYSVRTTQSPKRDVGTIALWPLVRACWVRVKKREKEGGFWLVDGVDVSVMACFINSCQCQPIHPSLVLEGQLRVYQSRCVLASSISLMVLACLAKCGHCVRHSESGMALGMMSLQSSHLTHAW